MTKRGWLVVGFSPAWRPVRVSIPYFLLHLFHSVQILPVVFRQARTSLLAVVFLDPLS